MRCIPVIVTLLAANALGWPAATFAQNAPPHTAEQWVQAGNLAYDARKAPDALRDYDAALAIEPKRYDALWHAALVNIDLGQYEPDKARQRAFYQKAEERARAAVAANPNDPSGHFVLAAALGRTALSLGTRDRIKYAGMIRDEARRCLELDPKQAGCLHVMGVWNAEVMRLNGFTRMIARNFLGGQVFSQASWANAQRYLVDAVAAEPRRIVHRLDLANVYRDRGMKAQAKAQYQLVVDGPLIDYNDPRYKDEARAALASL
jgi:tetratricopeptide (TPR) repeat protein